jgi:LEA14-like dessication related protein
MRFKYFFLLFVLGISFYSCRTVREIKNLAQCEFRTTTIENMSLASVSVQNYTSFEDIGMLEIGQLLAAISNKTLPLLLTINVEIKNSNEKTAALNYLDWIAEIDDVKIAEGVVNKRYEITSGSTVTMPVQVNSDLFKIFSNKEGRDLLSQMMGIKDEKNHPNKLVLKVKPSISVGKGYIKYPGYIRLKQNF